MASRAGSGRALSALKRAQIIQAGKVVFLDNGFGAASMDVIAASAGVSKMTIYRHFRSKELLFAGVIDALCRKIIDDDLEGMLTAATEAGLGDVREKGRRHHFRQGDHRTASDRRR